jgi:hypothetical protein
MPAMASDPLRRLEEGLRQVEDPSDLAPDLLLALETLASVFGTSPEGMRNRIIIWSSTGTGKSRLVEGFVRSVDDIDSRLAPLVIRGRASLPKREKQSRTTDDLIPVVGAMSDLIIEDRRR